MIKVKKISRSVSRNTDGSSWEYENYPAYNDKGTGEEWLNKKQISLENAKALVFQISEEAYDYEDEINEANDIEELQDALLELKEYQQDNTYNSSWWGGVIDFGVLTDDSAYGEALMILRMHRGGDPRGNYNEYEMFQLDSWAEDVPMYADILSYYIETEKGDIVLDTDDFEGYNLRVISDETGTFEEDDYVSLDEIEEKFNLDGNSIYNRGGIMTADSPMDYAKGGWIVGGKKKFVFADGSAFIVERTIDKQGIDKPILIKTTQQESVPSILLEEKSLAQKSLDQAKEKNINFPTLLVRLKKGNVFKKIYDTYAEGGEIKTNLSKLKKGDKFYFPLDKDDEEIGRTNPLDAIYVFNNKIKSTYHYSSKGSKFSTSTNRDIVTLPKDSTYAEGGNVEYNYFEVENNENGEISKTYERTNIASPNIPNAKKISKEEYEKNVYAEDETEYSCDNESCRKYYYGEYNSGYCSDECKNSYAEGGKLKKFFGKAKEVGGKAYEKGRAVAHYTKEKAKESIHKASKKNTMSVLSDVKRDRNVSNKEFDNIEETEDIVQEHYTFEPTAFVPKKDKGGKVNEVYIDFMNKDKNYSTDRKYFETYEDAERWAKKELDSFNPDMISYTYAKGGEIIFTDLSDNTQSRKEWESRKSKNTNQNSFGSFSHKINNRMVGSYYLYRLDNYDENYYSHIPLKDGEILARVETDNMVGGEMPLVKINILNGRVYFMSEENDLNSDEDDKNPKFNRASADVLYLSLDNYIKTYEKFLKNQKRGLTYAEGGEVNLPNGVFIYTTKTTQSKDEILEMYSNQGYTAIGGGSLLSDNFKKYNRNKDIYIIVGEIKHTSNNTMKGTIYMKKNEVAVQNFISKNTDAKVITKIPNTNIGSTYAEGGSMGGGVGTQIQFTIAPKNEYTTTKGFFETVYDNQEDYDWIYKFTVRKDGTGLLVADLKSFEEAKKQNFFMFDDFKITETKTYAEGGEIKVKEIDYNGKPAIEYSYSQGKDNAVGYIHWEKSEDDVVYADFHVPNKQISSVSDYGKELNREQADKWMREQFGEVFKSIKGGSTYAEGGGVRKPRLKKGDQVYIYGKTWFQKSYGNTYHITKVYVNNEIVGISEIQYGYGEQYVQTGMDILWNNFLPPYKWKMNYSSWRLKDFGIKIQTEETEVTRERDLNHTNYGKGGNISYDVQDLLKG